MFRKHATLPYTAYLQECTATLRANPQFSSDTTIEYHVRVAHIGIDVTKVFDHGSMDAMQGIDDDRMEILVKILDRQLKDVEASLPPEARADSKLHIINP